MMMKMRWTDGNERGTLVGLGDRKAKDWDKWQGRHGLRWVTWMFWGWSPGWHVLIWMVDITRKSRRVKISGWPGWHGLRWMAWITCNRVDDLKGIDFLCIKHVHSVQIRNMDLTHENSDSSAIERWVWLGIKRRFGHLGWFRIVVLHVWNYVDIAVEYKTLKTFHVAWQ